MVIPLMRKSLCVALSLNLVMVRKDRLYPIPVLRALLLFADPLLLRETFSLPCGLADF